MDGRNIKVLIALGGHRPMTKQEMEIKVGKWVLDHVQVLNHSPFSTDLVTIPDDDQVIKINKNYAVSYTHLDVYKRQGVSGSISQESTSFSTRLIGSSDIRTLPPAQA